METKGTGQMQEMKKDFSDDLKVKLPEAETLAKNGKLTEANELLLGLEKQARLANDIRTLKTVALRIVTLTRESNDWEALNANVSLIAKRRQQKGTVVTAVVQQAMKYLEEAPNEEIKLKLIESLRTVSEGKIHVEKERAELTQMLSKIREAEGKIEEAADILGSVHVETYGSMSKMEKAEYILEQIRLQIAKGDYVRAFIVSKKINRKVLQEADFQETKCRFFRMMVQYYTHEKDTFELFNCYHAIYNTPMVQEEEAKWKDVLPFAVVFLALSKYDKDTHNFMQLLNADEKLQQLPMFAALVKHFCTHEVIAYPVPDGVQQAFEAHSVLSEHEHAAEWRELLHTRIVEHNIRIIAGYYKRVQMGHLSSMLGLGAADAEKHISTLVTNGTIFARMDRPAGVITFQKPVLPETTLEGWSGNIKELLGLMDETCHLISKENMMHKVLA